MGPRRTTPRVFWLLVFCSCTSLVACDRSWRDENFVTPGAGPSPAPEPPRVRPSVPATPSADTSTGPDTPSSTNDAGATAEPPVEVDASVGDTGSSDGPDETSTAPSDSSETAQVDRSTTDDSASEVSSSPPEPIPFTKQALLEAASDCAVEQYEGFQDAAFDLKDAVGQLAGDAGKLSAARQAFTDAVLAFQRVELFRVGPAARAMDPGGRDLRDRIYAYPLLNRCQIDRNLVSEVYASDYASVLPNARGLGALEYLLYEQGSTNACSSGIDINAKGTWAELSNSELNARRFAYAKAVADDVAARAAELVKAWSPSGDGFRDVVLDAGNSSTVFVSQQAALNAFSHALFYIDKELKDFKLGWPLGIVAECTSGSCPYAAEFPYARLSGASIAQNLAAFRLLFEGCGKDYAGLGFDDWLHAADPDGDLAERLLTNVAAAESVVAALPRPLEDAFYDAPVEAQQVHTAVKRVTDLLKTEFVSLLNLELPMTAEGDND